MKLSDLVTIYQAIRPVFPQQFKGAEIVSEHDMLYIILDKPRAFSAKELEYLEELGLLIHQIVPSDNQVVAFYIYI